MIKFFRDKGFKLWRDEAGVTLTEMMIAVTLLSTGLMAYGSLSGRVMEKNIHSERESVATTLAQDKIEEIRDMVSDQVSLGPAFFYNNPVIIGANWNHGPSPENLDAEGGVDGTLQFSRSWSIIPSTAAAIGSLGRDGGNSINIYDVQVTVSWVNNGNRSVVLNSRVTQ